MMGEKDIMTCGTYGLNPKIYLNSGELILPENNQEEEDNRLAENGHHMQWVEACKASHGSD
jgi:hypothetical protein